MEYNGCWIFLNFDHLRTPFSYFADLSGYTTAGNWAQFHYSLPPQRLKIILHVLPLQVGFGVRLVMNMRSSNDHPPFGKSNAIMNEIGIG